MGTKIQMFSPKKTESPASIISTVQLWNLQSWADDVDPIDLKLKGLTIFKAPSETGKSVFYKGAMIACNHNYYGRNSIRGFVRRGCATGELRLVLADGTKITFIYRQDNKMEYTMYTTSGELKSWNSKTCPQEILDKLGWFLHPVTGNLLNFVNGKTMFCIDTTPASNAQVFKVFTEEPRMTQAAENISRWRDELAEPAKQLEPIVREKTALLNSLQYKSVDVMESKLETLKAIEKVWLAQDDAYQDWTWLRSLSNSRPADCSPITEEMTSLYNVSVDVCGALAALRDVMITLDTKPQSGECDLDLEKMEPLYKLAKAVSEVETVVDQISTMIAEKPHVANLTKWASLYDVSIKRDDLIGILKEYLMIRQQTAKLQVVNVDHLKPLYNVSVKVTETGAELRNYIAELVQYRQQLQVLNVSISRVKELQSQSGTCPLCGSSWENDSH